jgi:hypothetical protein
VLSDRFERRFAQDDDSVVGIKNIGSSAKNANRSKKSQALKDDDSVVGIKNIGSSAKNTKRSKKSQALRMTILCGNRKRTAVERGGYVRNSV